MLCRLLPLYCNTLLDVTSTLSRSDQPLLPPQQPLKQQRMTHVISPSPSSDDEVPSAVPSNEKSDRERFHQALLKKYCSSSPKTSLSHTPLAKQSHSTSSPLLIQQSAVYLQLPSLYHPLWMIPLQLCKFAGVPFEDTRDSRSSSSCQPISSPWLQQTLFPAEPQSTLSPTWFIASDSWDMHQKGDHW